MDRPNSAWYLVYTKPIKERVALKNLEQQDYAAYLPLMKIKKRRRGKYVELIEPTFPRYLFINLDRENDNWGSIRSTIGVAGLVRFGQFPAKVPDHLIAYLQQQELAGPESDKDRPLFVAGDKVKVAAGPFAGHDAVFKAEKAGDRVLVLLDIANRFTQLDLDKGAIVKD
jgi:transcriptional antiterminator RfaH